MSKKFYLPLIVAAALVFTGCDDDDDDDMTPMDPPNEEEVITTLEYRLTPVGGGTELQFLFQDLDGDGGDTAFINAETLTAGTVYNGSIFLLNETENPAEDITAEIEEEDDEHQFFFNIADTDVITGMTYGDVDGDGNPVGLSTTLSTGVAGTTDFTVTLRHEPNKDGPNVAQGDITNAGGETDIEVTFSVTVQ